MSQNDTKTQLKALGSSLKSFVLRVIKILKAIKSGVLDTIFSILQIAFLTIQLPFLILKNIKLLRCLICIFIILPAKYSIFKYSIRRSENRNFSGRIAKKQKTDPNYKKKFALVLDRFERRKKSKVKRGNPKLDLDQSFSGLVYAVLLISMLWTMMNSYVIYRNFFVNIHNKIQTQSNVIDLVSTNMMNAVDNYLNYIGDRALVFDAKHNLVAMKNILKKTPNRDIFQRNISSWLTVQYVNVDGEVSVSTLDGILKVRRDPASFFPVKPAVADPWRFKVGAMQHFENDIVSYDYLPVTMAIDTDDFNPIGTLLAEIPVDRIQHNIRDSLTESDLCYLVVDQNYDLVAKSEDVEQYDRTALQYNSYAVAVVQNQVINRSNYLIKKVEINNCDLTYYRRSSYGISSFVGYNKIRNAIARTPIIS